MPWLLNNLSRRKNVYDKLSIAESGREIRLLTIHPSPKPSALVRCSLGKVSLDDNPTFKALSYVWGDSELKHRIRINGLDARVTKGLHDALIRIRDAVEPRVFWIDALCINQDDITERSAQVTLMGDIYLRAEQVWGWVGPAKNGFDKTLASLDAASLRHDKLPQAVEFLRGLPTRVVEAFISLAESPFWSRTWILQEVTLGRDLYILFGDAKLPFDVIRNFILSCKHMVMTGWVPDLGGLGDTQLSRRFVAAFRNIVLVFDLRNKMRKIGRNTDPFDLLHSLGPFGATDPRDKIYGVCGLLQHLFNVDSTQIVLPIVDYKLSVTDVFAEFTVEQIRNTGSLEIILLAGLSRGNSGSHNLPSWTPDWAFDDSFTNSAGSSDFPLDPSLYDASSGCPCLQLQRPNQYTIEVKGVHFSTISAFTTSQSGTLAPEDILFMGSPLDYPLRGSRLEALFRVFTRDVSASARLSKDAFLKASVCTGFLVYLGRQTFSLAAARGVNNPDTCSESELEDSRHRMPLLVQGEDGSEFVAQIARTGSARDQFYIRAFRTWCFECLALLDAMLQGTVTPSAGPDGDFCTDAVGFRLPEVMIYRPRDSSLRRDPVELDKSNLTEWKKSFQQALTGNTTSTIIGELFPTEDIGVIEQSPLDLEIMRSNQFGTPRGKSLFVTDKGLFGTAGRNIEKGDLICVLPGSRVPVILRRRPFTEVYDMVGQCFVDGIMDGEVMQQLDEGLLKEQSFVIG